MTVEREAMELVWLMAEGLAPGCTATAEARPVNRIANQAMITATNAAVSRNSTT